MKYIMSIKREVVVNEHDFIVSKTDPKGRIVTGNRLHMRDQRLLCEDELLGQQYNIVRHPVMPRGVFHLLWWTIMQGASVSPM
ncbi:MAG: hypothetical protein P8103_19045 [Candidatus Thiodiazotropha sp.]|jgi:hypothetical protein